MRRLFFIASCFLASCTGSVNTADHSDSNSTEVDTARSTRNTQFDVVIFGKYCGHCLDNCTDMFRYGANGNPITLLADTTDSFLRNGKFQFDWFLTQKQHALANALAENIPGQLTAIADTLTRFGCPDCADQCGLYLETFDDSLQKRKKFYFDTDTAQVPRELRSFVSQLNDAVNQLKR